MEVLITTQGVDQAAKRFSKLARNAGTMEVAFASISEEMAAANERTWGRGVKLAESTLAQKAQDGTEPLVKTGRLKRSLTSKGHAEGAIREITPAGMKFGTSVFYARFQQYGTKTMPKHKVLKFSPKVRLFIKEQLRHHLMHR
jgi:phage gpG-like protein